MRNLIDIVEDPPVLEAFDSGDVNWIEQSEYRWLSVFYVNGIKFVVVFQREPPEKWNIQFITSDLDGWATTANTGEMKASAVKVFAAVLRAVEEFLKVRKPPTLSFAGDKDEGKADLYTRMMKSLAGRLHGLGYDVRQSRDDKNAREFVIHLNESVSRFRQILEDNQRTYYHGTTAVFDGAPWPSVSGIYGPGIYLSKNRQTALDYALRRGGENPIAKPYKIIGRLARDRDLTIALAQAREEGFVRNAKATRANEILAQQGYSGIEDGPVTVIFDPKDVVPL